ncbi:hypothetical protein [Phaeobacter sp. Ay1a-4a]|uniref:hypothetical protein n=1 Tax=Phaeobacter sp. Ay1a-4a TaxID=3112439 RepID=UPI003A835B78
MIELARAENIAMHKSWQGVAPVEKAPKKLTHKRFLNPRERQEAAKKARRIASQFARDRRIPVKLFLGRDPVNGSNNNRVSILRRECWQELAEGHNIPHRVISQVFGGRSATTISSGISLRKKQAGGKQK